MVSRQERSIVQKLMSNKEKQLGNFLRLQEFQWSGQKTEETVWGQSSEKLSMKGEIR